MVLDSKNFFIKNININRWPVADGNNCTAGFFKDKPRLEWLDLIIKDHNLKRPLSLCEPVPPFRMNKKIVLDMLDHDIFKMFETSVGSVTEFQLYCVWSYKFGNIMPVGPTTTFTFWHKEFIKDGNTDIYEMYYNWPGVNSFGLHRYAWPDKTLEFNPFVQWLSGKGLNIEILKKSLNCNYYKK